MRESYVYGRTRPLASLSERWVGQLLDSLVAIAAVLVSAIPYVFSQTLGAVCLLIGVFFALLYTLLADGLRKGQSYGKRIMKTAVIDASSGQPCTFGKSFLRNLLLALLGFIDWVFIFGAKRQRLGDKAANTIVVKYP